jgi:hypothetical protein
VATVPPERASKREAIVPPVLIKTTLAAIAMVPRGARHGHTRAGE